MHPDQITAEVLRECARFESVLDLLRTNPGVRPAEVQVALDKVSRCISDIRLESPEPVLVDVTTIGETKRTFVEVNP